MPQEFFFFISTRVSIPWGGRVHLRIETAPDGDRSGARSPQRMQNCMHACVTGNIGVHIVLLYRFIDSF